MPVKPREKGASGLLRILFLLGGLLRDLQGHTAFAEWSAIAKQETSYTSDAFQYSSARRLRFSEDPTLPTVVPLGKPEDIVWEPSLEVIKAVSSSFGRTEFSVKAHGYIYTDKPIFTHGDYRAQVRHQLDAATSILLRYRHLPNLFLGPNFERQTGQRLIQEERITTNRWRVEVERRLTADLTGTLVGRYGLRDYNEAFSERDTRFYMIGPRIAYRVLPWAITTVTYLYERGLADGAGDTRFNDDVSYRLHHVSGSVEITLMPRWLLTLEYTFQQKEFTSKLIGDTHFGRVDRLHQGFAELGFQATHHTRWWISVQQTQRTSTNALRDFNNVIVSIGGQYRF